MTSHPRCARIPTTSWTNVTRLHAGGDTLAAHRALATLCASYWYPLYAFARRGGSVSEDAEDAVQSFFASVVEKNILHSADAAAGRFRTFLLTAFTRHLNDLRKHRNAAIRGGGALHLPIDLPGAEDAYTGEPAHFADPAALYDRAWAQMTIRNAISALRAEETASHRASEFAAIENYIVPKGDDDSGTDAIATALGISGDNARKKLSRLRASFRRVLRDEIAATLTEPSPTSIDDELAAMRTALRHA